MSTKLAERVVVVTGAGRGIGAEVAKLCAREGAYVVVNDPGVGVDGTGQDSGPAGRVCAEITAAGGTAIVHHADVSDAEQADDLIATSIAEFGDVHVVANIAGILRDRMIFNLDDSDWRAVIDVHLTGTFNTSRAAARHWRAHAGVHRRLINTTSISGQHGSPGQPNYAAAKMGVIGLTYSCANALRKYGVSANAVSPGALTRMIGTIPGGIEGSPAFTAENIAPVYAYLASEQSGWLSGHVVGAYGRTIELFNRPEPIRGFATLQDHWSLAEVFAGIESSFRPAIEGCVNRYEADSRAASVGAES